MSNFTALSGLFTDYNDTLYWRFETLYIFDAGNSSSALNFRINQPPESGTCIINPPQGNTSTIFTISCSDWYDSDRIQKYSVYGMYPFSLEYKNHDDVPCFSLN